jgi:hypothetical protein
MIRNQTIAIERKNISANVYKNFHKYLSASDWTKIEACLYVANIVGICMHIFVLVYSILIKYKKLGLSERKSDVRVYTAINGFICHQSAVDIMRILYCLHYIRYLVEPIDVLFNNSAFYKYSLRLASLYSLLAMVTLVNILAIFVSEASRFYDLKLNSNDSSSALCTISGKLLSFKLALGSQLIDHNTFTYLKYEFELK